MHKERDRKSVVQGKSVDLGGRRIIKKKKKGDGEQKNAKGKKEQRTDVLGIDRDDAKDSSA